MKEPAGQPIVKGKTVDAHTRCMHYNSALDIIAIKFKCCGTYYPCYFCHQEEADHAAEIWKVTELDTKAILCGNCYVEMTIRDYKNSGYHCPSCNAPFNPKCSNHDHLYFERPNL